MQSRLGQNGSDKLLLIRWVPMRTASLYCFGGEHIHAFGADRDQQNLAKPAKMAHSHARHYIVKLCKISWLWGRSDTAGELCSDAEMILDEPLLSSVMSEIASGIKFAPEPVGIKDVFLLIVVVRTFNCVLVVPAESDCGVEIPLLRAVTLCITLE